MKGVTCEDLSTEEFIMKEGKFLEGAWEFPALKKKNNEKTNLKKFFILLAGDFRQILPIIPRSTPADEMNACLKNSIYGHT